MDWLCILWRQAWFEEHGQRSLSRVLVALTGLLLLAMPITEHLCNWDHFLRGGPDVEFTVLAWLLFAAMVVLSTHGIMLRPAWLCPASQGERLEENVDARRRRRSHFEPAPEPAAFAAGAATAPLRI